MKPYKIREDKVGTHGYECQKCNKSFQDKDIIFELDMYEEYNRFCSTECIMKWLESYIEKRQVEVYLMTKEQRTYKEVSDIIKGMKPNTRVSITDNLHVEYYEIEDMKRHYLVFGNFGLSLATFTIQADVVNYIIKKLK